MTLDQLNFSGIYMLKWVDTYFYVGKSINIRDRILQHIESFDKGTAAVKLQNAYDLYGAPDVFVLAECHSDNIDVIEAYFINLLKDDNMLNTAMMPPPFKHISEQVVDSIVNEYSKLSLGHMGTLLSELESRLKYLSTDFVVQGEELEYYKRIRTEEELNHDVSNTIVSLQAKTEELQESLEEEERAKKLLLEELEKIRKLPWYKKIFI